MSGQGDGKEILKTIGLSDDLYRYVQKVSLREPDVMRRLREETYKLKMAVMLLAPDEGQFMQLLVQLVGAKKTLDIGVFTGYSSLAVALAMPDDGKVVALDVSEEYTNIAKKFWKEAGVDHKIDLRLAPAMETLDALLADGQEGTFDISFIDADKGNYDNYYEASLKLVRVGGLIVVDNVLWDGKVADPAEDAPSTVAIRALNEKIHKDDRVFISMIALSDGVTIARRVK